MARLAVHKSLFRLEEILSSIEAGAEKATGPLPVTEDFQELRLAMVHCIRVSQLVPVIDLTAAFLTAPTQKSLHDVLLSVDEAAAALPGYQYFMDDHF